MVSMMVIISERAERLLVPPEQRRPRLLREGDDAKAVRGRQLRAERGGDVWNREHRLGISSDLQDCLGR